MQVGRVEAAQPRSAPRRVVFAFLDFRAGGAQRLALDTWRYMDRLRFAPALVCARGGGDLIAEARSLDLPVMELGRLRQARDPVAVAALARAFRELGAEIVHAPLYSRVSPYARLAGHVAGARLVVAHEHCRPQPPRPARRAADRLLARLPGARFVAVSAVDRQNLIRSGAPSNRIALIHNGVDRQRYAPRDRAATREALGLDVDAPVLLVPARLHPMKRHIDLIEACASLAERWPNLRLLCAGEGPLEGRLRALARSAGLAEQLRFLGQRHDLPQLYAAADLVVLASEVEGHPLSLLEAQCAGRAIVATRVGGVPEIVEHGRSGLIVEPGQPTELADAIAQLLSDPARRQGMEVAALDAAEGHGIEASVRRLEATYSRWLAERNALEEPPGSPLEDSTQAGGSAAKGRPAKGLDDATQPAALP